MMKAKSMCWVAGVVACLLTVGCLPEGGDGGSGGGGGGGPAENNTSGGGGTNGSNNTSGGGAEGAEILSVTIDPSIITQSETGLLEETFTIEIETEGFEPPIEGATATIDALDRQALAELSIDGDALTLDGIPYAWFAGAEPGSYPIAVTVFTGDVTVTRLDLATVTVLE